jgi:uncharacterized membrane protein
MKRERSKTNKIVMAALMMGLIMVMTFIIRIPIPATHGYIHLGDCMIFLAVLVLGWKYGAVAAGVGSAMADLIGGFAIYAPITLVVKFVMAAAVGLFIERALKKDYSSAGVTVMEVIGMCIGGFVMVAGYYVAECVMYGNMITPLASVPMNIVQFVVGAVIATAISRALASTPAGRSFAYDLTGDRSAGH